MNYTKTSLRFLLLVGFICLTPLVSFAAAATGDNDKEKEVKAQCDKDNKEKKAEASASIKAKPSTINYAASSEKSREIIPGLSNKADSSSVLSYNFIFYLVYKFKYSESEEEFTQESRTTD